MPETIVPAIRSPFENESSVVRLTNFHPFSANNGHLSTALTPTQSDAATNGTFILINSYSRVQRKQILVVEILAIEMPFHNFFDLRIILNEA